MPDNTKPLKCTTCKVAALLLTTESGLYFECPKCPNRITYDEGIGIIRATLVEHVQSTNVNAMTGGKRQVSLPGVTITYKPGKINYHSKEFFIDL